MLKLSAFILNNTMQLYVKTYKDCIFHEKKHLYYSFRHVTCCINRLYFSLTYVIYCRTICFNIRI